MITFTCGQCNTAIQVPDEHAGRKGRCPGCGTVVTIPPAYAAAPPPQPAPPPVQPYMPPQPYMPQPAWGPAPMPPGVGGPSKILAVLALIFGFVAIIPFLGALCGLAALVLGGISLAGKKPGKGMAVTGVIAGLLLGAGSTVGAVLLIIQFQHKGQEVRCRNNLHSIGIAVQAYASENRNRFPDDLDKLRPYVDRYELRCPRAESHHSDGDYIYAKPAERISDLRRPSRTIIACDRKGNHDGRRNAAYADGHVESIESEAELQRLLSEPDNAAMAKRLGEPGGR